MKQNNKFKRIGKTTPGYLLIQSMTLVRIPLSIIFAIVLLYTKNPRSNLIWSVILLLIIETTDAFDGKIARRYRLVSESGAILDPYSDSIARLIIYWSLASKNLVIFLVPLCMALRDVTVAYSRIILARNNKTVSARISGKIKASVQAVGSFLALFGPYYWNSVGYWSFYTLSWIILSVTLLSAIEYVKDAYLATRKN